MAFVLFFSLMASAMPTPALCEDGDALTRALNEKIAVLEARVEALEARIAQLTPVEPAPAAPGDFFALDEMFALDDSLIVTVKGYEAGQRFRYYPAGGFFSSTVAAKSGYQLLCVFLRVENRGSADKGVSKLLDVELLHGTDGVTRTINSFFYLTKQGVYAGGLKYFAPKGAIDGCLLFTLPDDSVLSGSPLTLRINCDGASYECALRYEETPSQEKTPTP